MADWLALLISDYEAQLRIQLEVEFCSLLRKHAYSNILKKLPPKKKNSDKNSDIFHISAQNIDCGYSLEPPMFLSRNKKNTVKPV